MAENAELLLQLGAVGSDIKNLVKRSDEDRQDNGRHRENQRKLHNEMRDEIRSMNDRVTRIEPIVEGLHTQGQRKKFARDLVRTFGRAALFIASGFSAWVIWFFGMFQKVGDQIAALMH